MKKFNLIQDKNFNYYEYQWIFKNQFNKIAVKTDKQFKYAEKKQIAWVVKNIENEILDAKNIKTGVGFRGKLEEFIEKLKV